MSSSIQANTDKSIDNIHQANLIAEQRLIQRKQERRRLYALEKTKIKPDHKLDPWDASRPKGYWNQSELFCLPPALSKSAHDLSTFNIRLEAMPRNNSVPPTSLALSKSFAGLLNSKGRNDQNKNDKQRLYQLMSVVKTIPMNDNRVEADSDKLESETEMDTNNDILFNRNNGDSHTAMYTDSTSNAKSANAKSSPRSRLSPRIHYGRGRLEGKTMEFLSPPNSRPNSSNKLRATSRPNSRNGNATSRRSRPTSSTSSVASSESESLPNSRPTTANMTGRRIYLDEFLTQRTKINNTTKTVYSTKTMKENESKRNAAIHGASKISTLILHRMTSKSLNVAGRLNGSFGLGLDFIGRNQYIQIFKLSNNVCNIIELTKLFVSLHEWQNETLNYLDLCHVGIGGNFKKVPNNDNNDNNDNKDTNDTNDTNDTKDTNDNNDNNDANEWKWKPPMNESERAADAMGKTFASDSCQIKILHLSNNGIGTEFSQRFLSGGEPLSTTSPHSLSKSKIPSSLISLKLRDNRINSLGSILSKSNENVLGSLRNLDLAWNDLSSVSRFSNISIAKPLNNEFHFTQSLRSINVSFCRMSDQLGVAFITSLSSSLLEEIYLDGNKLGKQTAYAIARWIQNRQGSKSLAVLSLSNNINLTFEGCLSILLLGVSNNTDRLKTIDLRGCHTGKD